MTASSARAPARRWQVLDGTALKLLAMALMTADHIHQMFAPAGAPLWLTILGRPVFPLFLFAAAEGFHYTRSRRRYLLRLLLASWGMTLLTTALQQAVPEPGVVLMNNAFSTFFVTGVYIQSWDWLTAGLRARRSTWPPPCSEAARNFFAKKCLTIRRRRSIILTALAPVAQLDRVSDYESEGREFESLPAHQASRSRGAFLFFRRRSPSRPPPRNSQGVPARRERPGFAAMAGAPGFSRAAPSACPPG